MVELRAVLLKRSIVVFLIGKEQFGQMLPSQDVEDEPGEHQGGDDRSHIEDTSKAFPSGALRVGEYLSIEHLVQAIQYESYGS
jgi:hypothetical protein